MILNLFIAEILLKIQILLPSQLWILRTGTTPESFQEFYLNGNNIGFRSQNVKVREKISHNV